MGHGPGAHPQRRDDRGEHHVECKTCGYSLWRIKERVCPECGSAFAPSEFDFNLNSVQFCCPHCNQDYYGTGDRGHLVPSVFNCVRCHRAITMDECVCLPTDGVGDDKTRVFVHPFLEDRRNVLFRFFSTIGAAMVRPAELGESAPKDRGLLPSIVFASVMSVAVTCIGGILFMFLIMSLGGMMGAATVPFIILGVLLAGPLTLLVWAVLSHGILKVSGETRGGFGLTFSTLNFCSGSNVLAIFPCLGMYVGNIWPLVSFCIALPKAQRVSAGRGVAAAVIPGLLAVAMPYAVFMAPMFMMGNMGAGGPGVAVALPLNATAVATTLPNDIRGGTAPAHVIEYIAAGTASSAEFTSSFRALTLEGQGVPDGWVSRDMQQQANELVRNAYAYRFGDVLLTYPGMDGTMPGELWIAVKAYDPTVSTFDVVMLDGSTRSAARSAMAEELAQQNALREASGLPALPDPQTVQRDEALFAEPTR